MEYSELTPEQQEKMKNLSTPDELLKFAMEEGFELTDEQLESVSGGEEWFGEPCEAVCNSKLY